VRQIFAMRARGLGAYQIAVTFNATGQAYRAGKTWSKSNILSVLRSEAVIGLTVFNRTDSRKQRVRPREEWVIVQTHEPLVERAIYDRVQKLMDDASESPAKGSAKSRHAFTGLLRCACGGGMVIETGKGRHGKVYSYYRCRRIRLGETCSDGRRFPAAKIDEWLSSVILSRVLTPENLREIVDAIAEESGRWSEQRRHRTSGLGAKIADLRARNAKLYELLELHGRDAPNLGDLTQRLRENSEQIKAYEAEQAGIREDLPTAAPAIDIEEIAGFMRTLLSNPENAPRARTFYASFINTIAVNGSEVVIDYDPARLLVATPARGVTWRGSQSANLASRWFQTANRRVAVELDPRLVARVPVSAVARAAAAG
jgi:site-specific DNA recombinase